MSWLFSQALVAEYWGGGCLDGEQSVPLSGNHTQLAYLPPDRMTAFSRLSRFGMTFRPLTADLGEDLLTLFRAGFLAKTYPQQEREQELKEADQVCGNTWHELSMKYDRDSHSWRTHQCLWDEALQWSLVTLPRWGMTVSGVLFQHPTAERPISETGSGLWATPTTMDKLPPKSAEALHREATVARPGRSKPANLRDQVSNMKQWPTPQARDWKGSSGRSIKGLECDLPTAVKWPTPQASDNRNRGNADTPAIARRIKAGKQVTLTMTVTGGQLNPTWVEKLMGWPEDWSSIKPISHIKMLFWLMGFEHDSERCVNQILRMLQKGNVQEEIREATGRFFGISEAAVLLAQLCEYTDRPYAWVFMESKKAFEKQMRGLRVSEETSSPSCRPEQQEQRAGEYSDALQALSRLLAHYGKEAWQDGSWEDAVPRVESNVSARVDRLKAIGNGQVPIVAATAFRILSGKRG